MRSIHPFPNQRAFSLLQSQTKQVKTQTPQLQFGKASNSAPEDFFVAQVETALNLLAQKLREISIANPSGESRGLGAGARYSELEACAQLITALSQQESLSPEERDILNLARFAIDNQTICFDMVRDGLSSNLKPDFMRQVFFRKFPDIGEKIHTQGLDGNILEKIKQRMRFGKALRIPGAS